MTGKEPWLAKERACGGLSTRGACYAAHASNIKPRSILAQPLLPLAEIGHHRVDLVPKGVRVVSVVEVTELMDDDVVDDGLRGHHALPVKRELP